MENRTVSGAYEKIEDHEKLCAERYKGIDEKLVAQGKQLTTINRSAAGIAIALLGWALVQLYALEPLRNAALHAPAAASARP